MPWPETTRAAPGGSGNGPWKNGSLGRATSTEDSERGADTQAERALLAELRLARLKRQDEIRQIDEIGVFLTRGCISLDQAVCAAEPFRRYSLWDEQFVNAFCKDVERQAEQHKRAASRRRGRA